MYRITSFLYTVTIICFAVLATSCNRYQVKYSGFLEDYSKLKQIDDEGNVLSYREPGVDLGNYNKLMVDEVVVWYSENSDYHGIHTRDLQTLTNSIERSLAHAMHDRYPIVEKAGKDVLRVRIAITDVIASKPGLDHLQAVLPITRARSEIKKSITGTHVNVGGATLEAEFLDSVSKRRLGAMVFHRPGQKKVVKGFMPLDDAEESFKFWVYRLRQQLDMEHASR